MTRASAVRSQDWVLPGASLLGLALAWELGVWLHGTPRWLLPSPSAILQALWEWRAHAPRHFGVTLCEALGGVSLAIGVGVPIAIGVVYSPAVRRGLYPLLVVLQSVPKVALAPLLLIYLGYGLHTNVTVAAVVAFFPIVVNMVTGLESVDPELVQLSRGLNPSALMLFWKVRLPGALPHLFSAVRIAVTLAVIGAVVGEFVGADRGLGYALLTASSTMNTPLVFGIMALLSVLGIGAFYAVDLIEFLACPWSRPLRDDEPIRDR